MTTTTEKLAHEAREAVRMIEEMIAAIGYEPSGRLKLDGLKQALAAHSAAQAQASEQCSGCDSPRACAYHGECLGRVVQASEDERVAFEAWATTVVALLDAPFSREVYPDGEYDHAKVHAMWLAWQARAGRASAQSVEDRAAHDNAILERGIQIGMVRAREIDGASAQAVSAWQPIETAPKDGMSFLGWVAAERWSALDGGGSGRSHDESTCDFCWYVPERPDETGGYFTNASGQIGDAQDITHWMHLPASPNGGAQ